MNKFEELQSSIITGTQFIKSYPMLNLINITPSEKAFIELVLSYQNNGQEFFMEYSEIAAILGIAKQSVSNLVKSLKSLEYITTNNSSRFKGKFIGSTTFTVVNEDKILIAIQSALSNKPSLEVEIVKEAKKKASKSITPKFEVVIPEPIKEVITNKQLTIEDELENRGLPLVIESEKIIDGLTKEEWREIYTIFNGRFAREGSPMSPADFKKITNDRYQSVLKIGSSYGATQKDFEGFWLIITELENKITNLEIA